VNQLVALNQKVKHLHIVEQVIATKKHIATSEWQRAQIKSAHTQKFYNTLQASVTKKLRTTPREQIPPSLISCGVGNKVCVVFGGDDGWCGGFNYQIIKQARVREFDKVYVFGAKVARDVRGQYIGSLSISGAEMLKFAQSLIDDLTNTTSISALYIQNRNAKWEELLPLAPHPGESDEIDSADNDLSNAPSMLLSSRLYQICKASQAEENFERILATDESSKNCSEMMATVKIDVNKERQRLITEAITEVTSGYIA
jgi:F0F1-type ATP synthase gamma subunit